MIAQSLTHLIFVVAWAFFGFEVMHILLMKLARLSRRIAGYTAAAAAISYLLGATGPLAWKSAGETASAIVQLPLQGSASAQRVFACPANAIVVPRLGLGFIDTVGVGKAPLGPEPKAIAIPAGAELHLNGWASLKTGPGTTICAIDNGRKVAGAVSYGLFRPDVAAAMGIPADNATGFSITLNPSAGKHIVAVGAVESDGRSIDRIVGTTLVVNAY